MKKIQNLYLVIIGIMVITFSCKKDTPVSDCGCNSPVIQTYYNRTGSLKYDTITSNYIIQENATQWINYYYICSDINKADSIYKKHEGGNINVNFSGEIKKICANSSISYIPESSHIMITLTQLNDITE